MSLFDYCEHGNQVGDCGMCRKRAQMDRVDENAADDWKAEAAGAVYRAASTYEMFTTDEVWKYIPAGVSTHENRAMGPVMKRAVAAGLCSPTGNYRPSARPSCNARPVMVYASSLLGSIEDAS